jgi:hypothetical protein
LKSAEAVERAAAFIAKHADAQSRACADALLGHGDAGAVVASLEPDEGDPEQLRAALAICDDLRALADPRIEGWIGALVRTQDADGGFAAGAPVPARLFETGMLAGHIAKTRYARPEVLLSAGDFLARHWDPDLVREGSWNAIAAYAHFFANADHDAADAVLQWCGRELSRGFLTRAFDAVRTARVLVYCDAHGLPGAELGVEELVVALITEQAPDGSFAAWEGEGARDRVASTLDGLVALRRLA